MAGLALAILPCHSCQTTVRRTGDAVAHWFGRPKQQADQFLAMNSVVAMAASDDLICNSSKLPRTNVQHASICAGLQSRRGNFPKQEIRTLVVAKAEKSTFGPQ
jgi:hypothetical protein